MTTFVCKECNELFQVTDPVVVQSLVNLHLARGGGFWCPTCCPMSVDEVIPVPLFSFEREKDSDENGRTIDA